MPYDEVAAIALGPEHLAGGQADAQRDLGGHRVLVGLAADAVGAEIEAFGHGRCPETNGNLDLSRESSANVKGPRDLHP